MAVPFSNTKLRVPSGFQGLLEGVAKDILQMQPNDIYAFSAVYFENLLQMRENGIMDPVAYQTSIQDRKYNNNSFQKPNIDANNKEQQEAAVRIQTKYRQHQSKGIVDEMRKKKAATKIQAGIRGHLSRKQVKNLRREMQASTRPNLSDEKDLRDLMQDDNFSIDDEQEPMTEGHELRDNEFMDDHEDEKSCAPEEMGSDIGVDLDDPDVQNSVTKIQAGYQGMRFRQKQRTVQQHVSEPGKSPRMKNENKRSQRNDLGLEEDAELELDENDPDTLKAVAEIQNSFGNLKMQAKRESDEIYEDQVAATKIQAGFKGMKTRKEINARKLGKETQDRRSVDSFQSAEEKESHKNDSDSEQTAAVTKIQAGFRGMKTRKEMKARKVKENEPLDRFLDQDVREPDTDDLDAEQAAAITKIQAGYRGMKVRKEMKDKNLGLSGSKKPIDRIIDAREPGDDAEEAAAVTKIQAGYRGMKVRKEMKDRRLSLSGSKEPIDRRDTREPGDVDAEQAAAVTKIQAGYRGMKTRREMKDKRLGLSVNNETSGRIIATREPGDDAEEAAAITKIQAGYRGMKARKEINDRRLGLSGNKEPAERITDLSEPDDDAEQAAAVTKIQAGYRGMKARKEMKDKRLGLSVNNETSGRIIATREPGDAEQAAAVTKIQAGYRGMKARKEMKDKRLGLSGGIEPAYRITDIREPDDDDAEQAAAVTKIQAGYRGMKTRREMKDKKPGLSGSKEPIDRIIDTREPGDDAEEAAAVTKIQAGYRGMKARKEMKDRRLGLSGNREPAKRITDIREPDDDAEQAAAVTKIQAGYRGMKARKEMKDKNLGLSGSNKPAGRIIDVKEPDDDAEKAAAVTKIQAGYRGMKIRKEVKELKHESGRSADSRERDTEESSESEQNTAVTKIQAGFRGMKTRKEINMKQKNNKDRNEPDDEILRAHLTERQPDEMSNLEQVTAANKIQAGFRGYQTRKELQIPKAEKKSQVEGDDSRNKYDLEELDDEETHHAVVKIQAGFKGYKARKDVEHLKREKMTTKERNNEHGENEEIS